MQPALGSWASQVGAAGCLVGGRGEARVAPSADRAANRNYTLARRRQIAEMLAGVAVRNDRAEGHFQDGVATAGAVTVRALPVGAALGVVVALVVVIEQRGQRGFGLEPDAATVPAVAAVGTTVGDEFLTAEAHAAAAPVAALDEHLDSIDEHARTPRAGGPAGGLRLVGADAHVARISASFELHVAVDLREERVVRAEPDVQAWLESGAPLPDQDRAARHELTSEALHAEHLRIGVPAVPGAADAFLVRHRSRPRST